MCPIEIDIFSNNLQNFLKMFANHILPDFEHGFLEKGE